MNKILLALLVLVFFPQKNHADDVRQFIEIYRDMIISFDVETIDSFYTDEFIEEQKKYFINKCGFICWLGLSNKWYNKYEEYVLLSNDLRRELVEIKYYGISIDPDERIKLILAKSSCDDTRSQEVFFFRRVAQEWKIDEVITSNWNGLADKEFVYRDMFLDFPSCNAKFEIKQN